MSLHPQPRVTRPHPTQREEGDGSRGLGLPPKLRWPDSAKLSHNLLGHHTRKGKKQGCRAGSVPDSLTLATQTGTQGLRPLLAGVNLDTGGHSQNPRVRAGHRLAPQCQGPTTPSPTSPPPLPPWNKVPSPHTSAQTERPMP